MVINEVNMSLFNKRQTFQVDVKRIKDSVHVPIIKLLRAKTNNNFNLYERIVSLCDNSIKARVKVKGSYLNFGIVFGEYAENKKEADYIWSECWKIWNGDHNHKEVFEFLKKVLGSILMIQVESDDGIWEYEPDSDKKIKIKNGETPDAAIYNLRRDRK